MSKSQEMKTILGGANSYYVSVRQQLWDKFFNVTLKDVGFSKFKLEHLMNLSYRINDTGELIGGLDKILPTSKKYIDNILIEYRDVQLKNFNLMFEEIAYCADINLDTVLEYANEILDISKKIGILSLELEEEGK